MPFAKTISLLSVATVLMASLLMLSGSIDHAASKTVALAGTLGWFISAPFWMGRTRENRDAGKPRDA